jgi:hypothetical protein
VTPRYVFAMPGSTESWKRTAVFLQSLPRGLWIQGQPIVEYAAYWGVILIALSSGIGTAVAAKSKTYAGRNEALLVLMLFTIMCASLAVTFALAVLTGQVHGYLPRRYGYVPYTFAVMTIFTALYACRRFVGQVPAMSAFGAVAGLALALQLVCLPLIRAQDRSVWNVITIAVRDAPYILYPVPGGNAHAGSPGLRGPNYPEIFESPLIAYWWQAQYSVVFAGARFVGYEATLEGDQARLVGSGLNGPPILVPIRSVAVIEPVEPPPDWRSPPLVKISILGDLFSLTGIKSYPPK